MQSSAPNSDALRAIRGDVSKLRTYLESNISLMDEPVGDGRVIRDVIFSITDAKKLAESKPRLDLL